MILVVVIALSALGILMVYSSSALKGYLADDDTFATVGPQIQWAVLGIVAMLVMMRVDYRYLRLASVPLYVVAVVLLVLVFVPEFNIVVGGSARWLKIGPLPAIHPAEIAKLALVVYLAHWFAKRGTRVGGFWSGTVPFLAITMPVAFLVFREPDLGTTMVITLTAFTMFFVAGANLVHLGVMAVTGRHRGLRASACAATRWIGSGSGSIRGRIAWATASTPSRACWPSGWAACSGPASGRAGSSSRTPSTTSSSPRSARSSGSSGRPSSSCCSSCWRTPGSGSRWPHPTPSGRCWRPASPAWLCIQALINIGVVVTLFPITGITLPFISAGGSSLIISFAAVGILLSISRETVEKGTWNTDADPDRGRRDGRTHLPGTRRGKVASRTPGRP